MPVMVYRQGDTHVEHGVACEAARIPTADLHMMLASGWVADVQELAHAEEKPATKKQPGPPKQR